MHVDHGLAAVELLQHRLEERVAEPLVAVIALQPDAVGLECVERVLDLLERGVDIQHRERCKQSEPARIIAYHLSAVIVADAHHLGGSVRPLIEPDAWGGRHR
jgi:hypothetical protein